MILAFLQAPSNVNGSVHRYIFALLKLWNTRPDIDTVEQFVKKNVCTAINRFFGSRTGRIVQFVRGRKCAVWCIFRRECELESDTVLSNGDRWIHMIGTFIVKGGISNRKYADSIITYDTRRINISIKNTCISLFRQRFARREIS